MISIEQIKEAISNVKSGADFPKYIQVLSKLGVIYYNTYVYDGHTDFFDFNQEKVSIEPKVENLYVADNTDAKQFKQDLKAHQEGNTDYITFCTDCAKSGIDRWEVDIVKMTCTYYDKADNIILVEAIPTM